jgi:hypothetical protein
MSTPSALDPQPSAVRQLARELVDRIFAVYNAEYIERCLREEPKSMLALAGRLRSALDADKKE